MDYFLTTYAKDYKWPVIIQHKKPEGTAPIDKALALAQQKYGEVVETKLEQIANAEIMPAQMGAPPQGIVSKFDQPNTYLRKLYSKYPYLYEIMKVTPPAELAKKVYSDRFKSTYQEDFDAKGFVEFQKTAASLMQDIKTQDKGTVEVCSDDFQEIHKDTKPCACDHDIKTRPCTCAQDAHPVVKRAWKPAPVSKMPRFPSEKVTKKPKAEQEKASVKLVQYKPYRSEYKDSISKIGALIIRKKLHFPQEDENTATN
ncbi:uncharacterized protein isoform X1 [Rhodnius prolixus]|uniref:Uncharacterized protein n=1 Tax=Rhodnius prolixus TaxID=13249 RepID=T1HHX6_RHOPR